MRKEQSYIARRELPAFDAEDNDVRIPAGTLVTGLDLERVVDVMTGEVLRLPRHVALNPTWYFATGFNPREVEVKLEELVHEVVRCNEGLQVDLLYKMAVDACPRAVPTYNSFTATLSADKRIEMRDQHGRSVTGLGHNRRFCTYHLKQRVAPRSDARVV
jgi:hypothetical protein